MSMNLIYLAAGNGRRFGSNKLMYPLNGRYLYRYALEALVSASEHHPDWQIVLVSQYEELLDDARTLPVLPVFCRESRMGISYSIRAGLSAKEADYYGFLVADQPYIKAGTLKKFFREMEQGKHLLGCVSWQGEDGNPTCFHRRFADELKALEGDCGGRKILRKYPQKVWRFAVAQKKELFDIDIPEAAVQTP